MQPENIPEALKARPQWVVWRLEERDGKPTKVPFTADGYKASSTDPSTWAPFDIVLPVFEDNGDHFDGIGFVFSEDDPFVGIDLDYHGRPGERPVFENGVLSGWARAIVDRFDSYTEVSQSGQGVHIIVEGVIPGDRRRTGQIEVYSAERFFVVTGDFLEDLPITIGDGQVALDAWYPEVFGVLQARVPTAPPADDDDPSTLSKLKAGRWQDLGYPSQSEADYALAIRFARMTDGDLALMDAMFRASGLWRPKWDRDSYGATTLARAAAAVKNTVVIDDLEGLEKEQAERPPEATAGGGKEKVNFEVVLRDRFLRAYRGALAYGRGEWHQYRAGWWEPVSDDRVKYKMQEVMGAATTRARQEAVLALVRPHLSVEDDIWDQKNVLVCRNKTFDLDAMTAREHRPEDYALSAVDYAYDPAAGCPTFERVVTEALPDTLPLLRRYLGYSLTRDTRHELSVFISGESGQGKSTVLEGLLALHGGTQSKRVTKFGVRDLESGRFAFSSIVGRYVLVATEQPAAYLEHGDILNEIISGEPLTVEKKFKDAYTVRPFAKVFWAMNDEPRLPTASHGLFRRIRLIRWPRLKGEADPAVKEAIKGEGAGLLNLALAGLLEVRAAEQRGVKDVDGIFAVPKGVQEAGAAFKHANDIAAQFLDERCEAFGPGTPEWADPEQHGCLLPTGQLYTAYKNWCETYGHKPKAHNRVTDDWKRLKLAYVERRGRRGYWKALRFGGDDSQIG